jgi:hypothetical protein
MTTELRPCPDVRFPAKRASGRSTADTRGLAVDTRNDFVLSRHAQSGHRRNGLPQRLEWFRVSYDSVLPAASRWLILAASQRAAASLRRHRRGAVLRVLCPDCRFWHAAMDCACPSQFYAGGLAGARIHGEYAGPTTHGAAARPSPCARSRPRHFEFYFPQLLGGGTRISASGLRHALPALAISA